MENKFESDPVYERFQLIVNGPALFNAVITGLELEIFRFLAQEPGASFDEIQQFTALPSHQLRVLMFALCTTRLIRRRDIDRGYVNSAFAQTNLVLQGADSWRDILLGWQKIYYPGFAHMTTALREGTNAAALARYTGTESTLYERLAHHPELEVLMHRSMAAFSLRTMPGLLDNADLSSVHKLLDVGGGDGTTARELAARHPGLQVTVLEMPTVSGLAREISLPDTAGRVRLHVGDLLDDPFPQGFDAILFSHVLEVFLKERILDLLAKSADALPSGGKLFIYGFNAVDDEQGGLFSARLSLYLNVLATGTGMAYPAADYEDWLRQVGYSEVTTITDLPFEHGLTVATKA